MSNPILLTRLSVEAAARVVAEFPGRGNQDNSMTAMDDKVEIEYFDKRWPYDIASWAFNEGLVSGSAASSVISRL